MSCSSAGGAAGWVDAQAVHSRSAAAMENFMARSLLRRLLRLHDLGRHGSVHAKEHFANRLGALTGLVLLVLEALHHPLVAAVAFRVGQTFGQCGAFLQ